MQKWTGTGFFLYVFRELLGPGNTWPGSPFHEGPERIGGCERPLHEAAKVQRNSKMSEMPECWDICQGELHPGSGSSSRQGRAAPSESSSTLDRELNSWVLATLDFSLALVQYLRTIFPFPLIWNSNVCSGPLCWKHSTFFLFHRRLQLRDCRESQKTVSTLDV